MIDDYEVIFAGVSSADLCIFAVNRPNILQQNGTSKLWKCRE